MITFANWYLFFLLPLPWFAWKFLRTHQESKSAINVPHLYSLYRYGNNSQSTLKPTGNIFSKVLLSLIWFCLILTAMKPQWQGALVNVQTSGRDMMLAVDISGSMSEQDMEWNNDVVTRLEAVKRVVSDFAIKRHGDRLGLILYASNAYVQAPLTYDRQSVVTLLNEAFIKLAGTETAIGDAMALAVKRLYDRPENHRIAILLTDGQNTAGKTNPSDATELAKLAGVKFYTIGVGSDTKMFRDILGNIRKVRAQSSIDENTLQHIAEQTGGKYFRAKDAASLQAIYDEINTYEPVEQDQRSYHPTKSFYIWPLMIALLLSLLLMLLQAKKAGVLHG